MVVGGDNDSGGTVANASSASKQATLVPTVTPTLPPTTAGATSTTAPQPTISPTQPIVPNSSFETTSSQGTTTEDDNDTDNESPEVSSPTFIPTISTPPLTPSPTLVGTTGPPTDVMTPQTAQVTFWPTYQGSPTQVSPLPTGPELSTPFPSTLGPAAPEDGWLKAILLEIIENFDVNSTLEALTNSYSPQSRAKDWLENHQQFNTMEDWRKLQLFALATFWYKFGGEDDLMPVQWLRQNAGEDECTWPQHSPQDEVCNNMSHYQRLLFEGIHLTEGGGMPPEVAFLTDLEILGFTSSPYVSTSLDSLIPSQLTNLFNLRLFVFEQSPNVGGIIAENLWELESLWEVHLGGNALAGTISSDISKLPNLRFLDLSNNTLSGTIPTEIGTLRNVESINLSENLELNGLLPTEIGLLNNLWHLDLHRTGVYGRLPEQFCPRILSDVPPKLILNTNIECPKSCYGGCQQIIEREV